MGVAVSKVLELVHVAKLCKVSMGPPGDSRVSTQTEAKSIINILRLHLDYEVLVVSVSICNAICNLPLNYQYNKLNIIITECNTEDSGLLVLYLGEKELKLILFLSQCHTIMFLAVSSLSCFSWLDGQ